MKMGGFQLVPLLRHTLGNHFEKRLLYLPHSKLHLDPLKLIYHIAFFSIVSIFFREYYL